MTSFVSNPSGFPREIKEGAGISITETLAGIQFTYTGTASVSTGTGTGDITGQGTIGQLAYFSGTKYIQGDAGLTYNPSNKQLIVDSIQFSTNPTFSGTTAGALYWDGDDNTLNLNMPGGNVSAQLAQEQLIRVYNNTGQTINNGQLVYINGANGNRPTIALAGNNQETISATTIGMATENIGNTFGYVTTQGLVRDVNTNSYIAGTVLYLGISGSYTDVKPSAPSHLVVIGTVIRQHATQGIIYVNINNGWELSELHDVYITGSASGQLLQYTTGSFWKNTNLANLGLSVTDISYPGVNNPAYTNLGQISSLTLSAGVLFSAPRITRVNNTTINIAGGTGLFRTINSPTGTMVIGTWQATGSFAVSPTVPTYIGVSYNNGTPQVVGYSSFSQFNWYTDFPIGKVYTSTNDIHIVQAEAHSEDTANLTRKMLRQAFPFIPTKAPEGGGLAIGEKTGRYITLTAGGMWHGFNYYPIQSLDTSVSGSCSAWYKSGTIWIEQTGTINWPNAQYNNTASGLVTMTNNKYAVLWFYVDAADSDVHIIYGTNEYSNTASAEAEPLPSTPLPISINEHGTLLGRFIFQKSAASTTSIQSAITTNFQTAGITNHNDLSSIQGGATGDYYHITSGTASQLALKRTSNVFDQPNYFSGTTTFTQIASFINGSGSAIQLSATAGVNNGGWITADDTNLYISAGTKFLNGGWVNTSYANNPRINISPLTVSFDVGNAAGVGAPETFSSILTIGNTGLNIGGPVANLSLLGDRFKVSTPSGNIYGSGTLQVMGNIGIGILPNASYGIYTNKPIFISGSAIFGGNIGIGTLAPTNKLEVIGNEYFSGTATITNGLNVGGDIRLTATAKKLYLTRNTGDLQLAAAWYGDASTGGTAAGNNLFIGASNDIYLYSHGVGNNIARFDTNATGYIYGGLNIGPTTIGSSYHGVLAVRGSKNESNYYTGTAIESAAYFLASGSNSGVAIGGLTTIVDGMIMPASTNRNIRFAYYNGTGYTETFLTGGLGNIFTGNLKITGLAGSGNRAVYSDANGTLTNSSSDAQLKTNIENIKNILPTVKKLRAVRYNWKNPENLGTQKEIGFIAQEIQLLVPEIVGENADGTLSIDYPKLTAILAQAIIEIAEKLGI